MHEAHLEQPAHSGVPPHFVPWKLRPHPRDFPFAMPQQRAVRASKLEAERLAEKVRLIDAEKFLQNERLRDLTRR